MAMATSDWESIQQYPANPYIRKNYQQVRAGQESMPSEAEVKQTTFLQGGGDMFTQGEGGGGASGYWTAPSVRSKPKKSGMAWAEENLSPEFMGARQNIYDLYSQQPQSLADIYKSQLEGQPELEQIEYNRALARLKGQMGTATRGLMANMSGMPGGMDSGAYAGSLADIQRQLLSGTGELSTNAYMKNLADQEARNKQLIEYMNQDFANQMGYAQGYGGWMQQMFPFEQWTHQFPAQLAAQRAAAVQKKAILEEQMNRARREESMGWLDKLMDWQGQQAGQYYGGQGQWGGYQNQRGQNILGGYGPGWIPPY